MYRERQTTSAFIRIEKDDLTDYQIFCRELKLQANDLDCFLRGDDLWFDAESARRVGLVMAIQ